RPDRLRRRGAADPRAACAGSGDGMIAHDLRLVSMNRDDGTLHCRVHGLLPRDEAENAWARSGLTRTGIEITDQRAPRWLTRLLDLAGYLGHPKCRPIQ